MLVLLTLTTLASAANLQFQADAHIHTFPESWRPAGMNTADLRTLELQAEGLHTPFYVVMVRGEELPGSGAGQPRLQRFTDQLMAQWGSEGLDMSRYSVFSVAWSEDCALAPGRRRAGSVCEYFLNTGSEFIHGPAHFLPSRDHKPFTDRFRSKVAKTPQDPAGGIRDVMTAVDDMLWSRTDPRVVGPRARKELEDQIARRRSLMAAVNEVEKASLAPMVDDSLAVLERSDIDEMHRMRDSLRADNDRVAAAVKALQTAHIVLDRTLADLETTLADSVVDGTEAQSAAQATLNRLQAKKSDALTPEALSVLVDQAREAIGVLDAILNAHRAEQRRKHHQRLMGGMGGTFLVMLGLGAIAIRRYRRTRSAARFEEARKKREEQLTHAAARYTSLELNDRAALHVLADGCTGITTEELAAVQAELDDIYAGIKALERALARCVDIARAAGPLAWPTFDRATKAIDATFTFDTGQLKHDALFEGPTHVLEVDPPSFMAALDDRFTAVVARRQDLLNAAAIRFRPAVDLLPHEDFDELLARARAHGIPDTWLNDHPLYGDDESDAKVWGGLDRIRQDDPLACLRQLDRLRATHTGCDERISSLHAALSALDKVSTDSAPTHPASTVSPSDDPTTSWTRARGLEVRARTILAMGSASDDVVDLLQRFEDAAATYRQAQHQAQAIEDAVRTIGFDISSAQRSAHNVQGLIASRQDAIQQAARIHKRAAEAVDWLRSGQRRLDEAQDQLTSASALRTQHRHLDASRTTQATVATLSLVEDDLAQIDSHLHDLEAQRRRWEEQSAAAAAKRRAAASRVTEYGGTSRLDSIPSVSNAMGPVDYGAQLAALQAIEAQWRATVRSAKRSYEQKKAAEAARRRAAQAASSSSSSFGSSSGGGSSFGGGGSTGGGGGW